MKVLLIDNYDSFTYNLSQLLYESNLCDFDIVKNDKIDFDDVNYYDKILLSPGAGIPSEAGKMMKLIKHFHTNKSILGICLGMQAIAEFFGGTLYNLPKVYHGIKQRIKIDNTEKIFTGMQEIQYVGLYHSWAVLDKNLPESLKITAISDDNIIMGLKHKIYDVNGVQFHPESYITENGKKMIENWLR